jgi:hypothetical protein
MTTAWKYTDASHKAVMRTNDDGSLESCSSDRVDVVAWVAAGNAILAPDPVVLSQDDKDIAAARAYAKLTALMGMTPAQVQAWVAANVTTLAQAQDVITTLAIAVSILARRL